LRMSGEGALRLRRDLESHSDRELERHKIESDGRDHLDCSQRDVEEGRALSVEGEKRDAGLSEEKTYDARNQVCQPSQPELLPRSQEPGEHIDVEVTALLRREECAEESDPDNKVPGRRIAPEDAAVKKIPQKHLNDGKPHHDAEEKNEGCVHQPGK